MHLEFPRHFLSERLIVFYIWREVGSCFNKENGTAILIQKLIDTLFSQSHYHDHLSNLLVLQELSQHLYRDLRDKFVT